MQQAIYSLGLAAAFTLASALVIGSMAALSYAIDRFGAWFMRTRDWLVACHKILQLKREGIDVPAYYRREHERILLEISGRRSVDNRSRGE